MHDLTLGGPIVVGIEKDAKHDGPCYDGVYGCHKCWNAANDFQGTESTCEWCKKRVLTLVVRAWDEPVMYALCSDCRIKQARQIADEEEAYERRRQGAYYDPYGE